MQCWEFKQCGRKEDCPAPWAKELDGINSGKNGGRVCWGVANTLCEEGAQQTFEHKFATCLDCDFYRLVCDEENAASKNLLDMINPMIPVDMDIRQSNSN